MTDSTLLSRTRRVIAAGACAAALFAAGAAAAAEPPAESPTPAPAVDRAATTNGPIITWSSARGRFESPAPEAARQLVAELYAALAATPAVATRLGSDTDSKIERLPSGVARMRVPLRFVNLAAGRATGSAVEVAACTQGPAPASGVSTTLAPASATPVER